MHVKLREHQGIHQAVHTENLVNLKHGNQRAMALLQHVLTALDAHAREVKGDATDALPSST
jgi:hypothetical protein